MMKKIALVIMLGLTVVGGSLYSTSNTISDKELVKMYFAEEHQDETYDIEVYEDDESKFIEYIAYQDGKAMYCGSINKDYYTSRYIN